MPSGQAGDQGFPSEGKTLFAKSNRAELELRAMNPVDKPKEEQRFQPQLRIWWIPFIWGARVGSASIPVQKVPERIKPDYSWRTIAILIAVASLLTLLIIFAAAK
jgi:hypothetical protein